MPKIVPRPIRRICVNLFIDDIEKIKHYVKLDGGPNFNELVRTIVHSYVTNTESLIRKNIDQLATTKAITEKEKAQ